MKTKLIKTLFFLLVICVLPSSVVLANEEKQENTKVIVEQFPELATTKFGVVELENLANKNSPNYDPSLLTEDEGTRFGPPGKRNLDFYRKLGIPIDKESATLEKDLNKVDPYPGDIDYGTLIYDGNDVEATQAYQKIHTGLNLNENGQCLYAPTMMPPDHSRLEIVIRYTRNGGVTSRTLAVFCHDPNTVGVGTWTNIYSLDQGAFQYRYVNGADEVITRITKTGSDNNPTWTAYLYDLVDNEWDWMAYVTGNSPFYDGWNAWEAWNIDGIPSWPTLPEITSRYLIVTINSTPYYVTSTYGEEWDNSGNMPYSTDMISNYYEWSVGP